MTNPVMNEGGKMEKVLTKSKSDAAMQDEFELKVSDRCDRCGAQAFGAAFKDGMDILFCGHHLREHSPALAMQGFHILDLTSRINARPSDPTSSVF